MNKSGRGLLIAIIIAVMIFMAGMLFINPIKDDVTTARSSANMDCSNQTISDGAKLACLGIDITIPYLMWGVLSAAIGMIIARIAI